jgi:hypothetical protein
MELTEGILKSVESSFYQCYNRTNNLKFCVVKYKGVIMNDGKKPFFKSEAYAKTFVTKFVELIFRHGEYYQSGADKSMEHYGYKIDYSATIKILPQYGLTSRFELPENKKMFKDIATKLLEDGIITIEKIEIK